MAIIEEHAGDARDDSSTRYTMSLGDTFQGTLDSADDGDWVRVELVRGVIYDVSHYGKDARLSLYDAAGNPIVNGNLRPPGEKLIFGPDVSGTYFVGIAGSKHDPTAWYDIVLVENTNPVGSVDAIAAYLTDGWWRDHEGAPSHRMDVASGGVLTANITALTDAGKQLARAALDAWTNVTGISFELVDGNDAQLTFDDDREGAGARIVKQNGVIVSAHINVSTDWLMAFGSTTDSYSMRTYMHEIGHVLGLGHVKPDAYSADFGVAEVSLLNSWQATVMSGYSQNRNSYIDASYAYPVTPMIADILAVQALYGVPDDSNRGDTIYGYRSNVAGYLGEFFTLWTGEGDPFVHIDLQPYNNYPALITLASADLDGDGDPDLVIGSGDGAFQYLENTGSLSFVQRTGAGNPLDGVDIGSYSAPALADLDGDGDLDLIAGSSNDDIAYFENTGTATSPRFQPSAAARPIPCTALTQVISASRPWPTSTATATSISLPGSIRRKLPTSRTPARQRLPAFTQRSGAANPMGNLDLEHYLVPALTDLDGDGDADLVVWGRDRRYGAPDYFENTGTATSPGFTARRGAASPLDTLHAGYISVPLFADLDGDGDPDLVAGRRDSTLAYFENTGTQAVPAFVATSTGNPAALTLYDSAGNDTLDLRTDHDSQRIDLRPEGMSDVYGLVGNLIIARDVVIENVIAGSGDDAVTGNAAANRLEGRSGDDVLAGGPGADTLIGGPGADTLDGGPGSDTASYETSGSRVDVRLSGTVVDQGDATGDTLIHIENLTGSAHDDVLAGNGQANVLAGLAGDDLLWGSGGDDLLVGGAGADRLAGGPGHDTASWAGSGEAVTVRLHSLKAAGGDAEGDTFPDTVDVAYTDEAGVVQIDALPDVEHLIGSAHDDILAGDRRDNRMEGGRGDDTLYGGPGGGDDDLSGGPGDDRLFGGQGADTLTGGPGDDALAGGPGADRFVFRPDDGADTVIAFERGIDNIDLTAFDIGSIDDLAMTASAEGVTVDLADSGGGSILLAGLTTLPDAGDFLV